MWAHSLLHNFHNYVSTLQKNPLYSIRSLCATYIRVYYKYSSEACKNCTVEPLPTEPWSYVEISKILYNSSLLYEYLIVLNAILNKASTSYSDFEKKKSTKCKITLTVHILTTDSTQIWNCRIPILREFTLFIKFVLFCLGSIVLQKVAFSLLLKIQQVFFQLHSTQDACVGVSATMCYN